MCVWVFLQVVDMRNYNDYAMKQAEFFKAFTNGGDTLGGAHAPLMLKVKDYPPEAAFADEMPRHWQVSFSCCCCADVQLTVQTIQ